MLGGWNNTLSVTKACIEVPEPFIIWNNAYSRGGLAYSGAHPFVLIIIRSDTQGAGQIVIPETFFVSSNMILLKRPGISKILPYCSKSIFSKNFRTYGFCRNIQII